MVRNEEIFLIGAHISPLSAASTHVHPDPVRTRKLLLHAEEIRRLIGRVDRAGYTLVPLDLHYVRGRVRSEEHTSELQSLAYLVCRLLLEKKKKVTHDGRRPIYADVSCPHLRQRHAAP